MLNQIFTVENYMKVIHYLNRKGGNFEKKYFEDIYIKFHKEYLALQEKSKEIMDKSSQEYQAIQDKKKKLREEKNEAIKDALKNIKLHNIKIKQIQAPKPLYIIDESCLSHKQRLEQELNLRLLYKNLSQAFNVRQANRDLILHQISAILKDKLKDMHLCKLDIQGFYESIDHKKIEDILFMNPRLLRDNVRLVKDILNQYKDLSKNSSGIPRGINISAILGEIYLQYLDNTIKNSIDTIYYARYVDDIFIISLNPAIRNIVEENLKKILLKVNDKSQAIDLNSPQFSFTYLGYDFKKDNNSKKLEITISGKRMDKYRSKIDRCFTSYDINIQKSGVNANQLKGLLKERLRCIYQNTRISGYAKVIFTGAFYSNRFITTTNQLSELDSHIDEALGRRNLKFEGIHNKFCYYFCNHNEIKHWALEKSPVAKKFAKIYKVWK